MTAAPRHVAVFGGGRMGAGIAHAFLSAGSDVTVIEGNDEAASQARGRITSSLKRSAQAAADAPATEPIGNLVVTCESSGLGSADLVIEAVPEMVEIKTSVLARAEELAPMAILATNTSSLSIDGLGAALRRPERFVGLHFFNPVPVSDLVEVVVGTSTGADVLEAAHDWVTSLGKVAITVQDSPGFASSRLGVCQALEAIRMLEDGVASATDIDVAMTLGYRHSAGPLRTTDLVGLDVRLAIAQHLERELGPRFAPPQLLIDKVASGEIGRKAGRGFFEW